MGIKEKLQAKLGRPPTAAEIEEGRQKRDAKKQTAAPSSSAPPAKSATPNMLLVGKKDGKKDGKRKVEEMASSAEPPAKRSAPAAPPHTPVHSNISCFQYIVSLHIVGLMSCLPSAANYVLHFHGGCIGCEVAQI